MNVPLIVLDEIKKHHGESGLVAVEFEVRV
jgi:hypothetical protein